MKLKLAFFAFILLLFLGIGSVSAFEIDDNGDYIVDECATINESGVYKLANDINDVEGTCIIINADEVDFSLQGFTISADDNKTIGEAAILIKKDSDLVGVGNGFIEGFDSGVFADRASNVEIDNLELDNNNYAIRVERTFNANILDIVAKDNGDSGIFVYDSPNATVHNNRVYGGTGYGIRMKSNTGGIITRNYVTDTGSVGIYVHLNSDESFISENRIERANNFGIRVDSSPKTEVLSNEILDVNGTGVFAIYSDDLHISGGIIDNPANMGIKIESSEGIVFDEFTIISSENAGISIYNSSNGKINTIQIEQSGSYGTILQSVSESEFRNLQFAENGDSDISLKNSNNLTFEEISSRSSMEGILLENSSFNSFNDLDITNNADVGISVKLESNENNFENIRIDNATRGVYIIFAKENQFKDVKISNTSKEGFLLNAKADNTTLDNVSFTNIDENFSEIELTSPGINNVKIYDSFFNNYKFIESIFGYYLRDVAAIEFNEPLLADGMNFTSDVELGNNYAMLRSLQSGFNISANLTFYNLIDDNLTMLKNGAKCSETDCVRIESEEIAYQIKGRGNYTLTSNFTEINNTNSTNSTNSTINTNNTTPSSTSNTNTRSRSSSTSSSSKPVPVKQLNATNSVIPSNNTEEPLYINQAQNLSSDEVSPITGAVIGITSKQDIIVKLFVIALIALFAIISYKKSKKANP